VATSDGPGPLESLTIAVDERPEQCDLADVDLLALPLWEPTLLSIVKLFVDATLPGAQYDVPPPPLSADPGVSLIAAGTAAAKEKSVSLLLDWGF